MEKMYSPISPTYMRTTDPVIILKSLPFGPTGDPVYSTNDAVAGHDTQSSAILAELANSIFLGTSYG